MTGQNEQLNSPLTKVESSRPVYRQSHLDMFLRCGKQFEFRYLKGIISPPSAALTVGSSTHAGIAKNFIIKKENGVGCTAEELKDTVASDFDVRSKETEFKEDENPGALKDVAIQCAIAHHTEIAPHIQPDTVEESFIIETDAGYDLAGTLDLISTEGVIHDAKTSKSKYADDSVSGAIQPAMYDFAYEQLRGKKAKAFQYDVLIKPTKTIGARTQTVRGKVNKNDRAWLFETITQVDKAIKAGVFLPAPEDSWVCNSKWCGYWSICKGKK